MGRLIFLILGVALFPSLAEANASWVSIVVWEQKLHTFEVIAFSLVLESLVVRYITRQGLLRSLIVTSIINLVSFGAGIVLHYMGLHIFFLGRKLWGPISFFGEGFIFALCSAFIEFFVLRLLCESKENFPLGKTIKTLGKGFAFFLLVVFIRPVDFWRDILVTPWVKTTTWIIWLCAFPLVLILRDIPFFRVETPINTRKAYKLFFLVNVLMSFLAVAYRFGLLRSVL